MYLVRRSAHLLRGVDLGTRGRIPRDEQNKHTGRDATPKEHHVDYKAVREFYQNLTAGDLDAAARSFTAVVDWDCGSSTSLPDVPFTGKRSAEPSEMLPLMYEAGGALSVDSIQVVDLGCETVTDPFPGTFSAQLNVSYTHHPTGRRASGIELHHGLVVGGKIERLKIRSDPALLMIWSDHDPLQLTELDTAIKDDWAAAAAASNNAPAQ